MFTGIVKEVAKIKSIKKNNKILVLYIISRLKNSFFAKGESICVNGVCLTVESYENHIFSVSLVKETVKKTNLGDLKVDSLVNLEPSLKVSDFISGHMVTGHVDDCAEVIKSGSDFCLKIKKKYIKFFPEKSSITVNGVSLTVKKRVSDKIFISLIPETLKHTNLSFLKPGDKVNIEVDILARYLKSLI